MSPSNARGSGRVSGGSPAPGGSFSMVVTPDYVTRVKRVTTLAQAAAAGGRYPQVLEDCNVVLARLIETDDNAPSAHGTTVEDRRNLVVGIISVREAASRLGCSARAIRQRIAGGRLAATKPGRDWLIREDDFEKYRFERRHHEQHRHQG